MVKYTSFKDIPRFISHGNYAVDVGVQETAIILTARTSWGNIFFFA